MKVLVIDNHSKFLENLVCMFPAEVTVATQKDLLGVNYALYDLIVLSGGSHVPTVLNHPENYATEIDLVKNTTVAILGICLGCEIVSSAFGGTLEELATPHSGTVSLMIQNESLKSKLKTNTPKVHESHQIRTTKLPADFEVCASSDHGFEIIKHKTKPIIGLQFHPELDSNTDLLEWIFETLGLLEK